MTVSSHSPRSEAANEVRRLLDELTEASHG
jgi:hypothetical protein